MKAWSTNQLGSLLTVIQLLTEEPGLQTLTLSSRTHGLTHMLPRFPNLENTPAKPILGFYKQTYNFNLHLHF